MSEDMEASGHGDPESSTFVGSCSTRLGVDKAMLYWKTFSRLLPLAQNKVYCDFYYVCISDSRIEVDLSMEQT